MPFCGYFVIYLDEALSTAAQLLHLTTIVRDMPMGGEDGGVDGWVAVCFYRCYRCEEVYVSQGFMQEMGKVCVCEEFMQRMGELCVGDMCVQKIVRGEVYIGGEL